VTLPKAQTAADREGCIRLECGRFYFCV
jgi:hypothetical protein